MTPLNGIILCGGNSKRMGADKAFLDYKGQTFLARIIAQIQPFCETVYLCGNKPSYAEFGLEVVPDLIPDSGALGGLYSGLHRSETPWNLVLSCDAPLVDSEIMESLINSIHPQLKAIHAQTAKDAHPLVGCYHQNCLPIFEKAIKNGRLKLQPAVSACNPKTLEITGAQASKLRNINTPEDYKSLLKLDS
ncbi:molybdenum cofactor guanylyltransferase [Gilvibacter sediminis]|uniref:molybdenum cofactor guanylyltransferase n=1 Tax=Gilvibacter sediminis TaxID=379071 RepID=UPI002350CE48|nr:molybdenum cofactor guanylyltransferase [Gilvibacter sediminis]MDC7996644.1 molybdenum cofactor guanylyltransferase [Gilvibacter sediminis]